MRSTVVRVALLVVAAALTAVLLMPAPPPDRLTVRGERFFLAGVNYPWRTGQDFGTGAWGHSGVSNPTTRAEVETDFANMAAHGVRIVKWRVFGDGRYSPEFDEHGVPVGFDERFFMDLDAALDIAERHDIYLVLVLFDSGLWATHCDNKGVQLGGHADVLTDPMKRQALVDRVIVPFLRHVDNHPRVVAYEVVAEPDWGVRELHTDDDGRIKVTLDQARAFIRSIVGAIRAESGALVTVEANRSRNMAAWRNLGLDYYSFSWYDWLEPYDPLQVDAASFGLDRPIVLGEYPTRSSVYDLETILDTTFERGYAGAFAWSFVGADRYGSLVDQRAAYVAWLERRWPALHLFAPHPPSPDVPLLPPPYAVQDVHLGIDRAGVAVKADLLVRDGSSVVARFFVTPVGETDAKAGATTSAVPDERGLATLRGTLAGLVEGQPYKLSLGLFGRDGSLLKWFDNLAHLQVEQGRIRQPELATLALENPCQR